MIADASPPPAVACAALPESVSYIGEIHARAYERWNPPSSSGPIKIAFQVDEHGNVVYSEVRSSENQAAGEAAREALLGAAPYPPMPEAAKCLANMRLVATFSTPVGRGGVLWVVGGTMAFSLALITAILLFQMRRREEASPAGAGGESLALEPGDEHLFYRSAWQRWLELGLVIHSGLFISREPWFVAGVLLFDAFAVYAFVKDRRSPLLRVTPLEIESFATTHSKAGRMFTHELASWAATRAVLVLRSARGEELRVPLVSLARRDTELLLSLMRGLRLASSTEAPLQASDVRRLQLRRLAWILALMVATTAATVWFTLRALR